MASSVFDLITRASSLSLGELNARLPGDSASTASELVSLFHGKLIEFKNAETLVNLPPPDMSAQLATILDSTDQANTIFVSPTVAGFKKLG